MSTQTFPTLTVEFVNNNIGKEITWFAYGDKANFPYKGICRLIGMEQTTRINPVTNTPYVRPVVEHIKGDELSFGYQQEDFITYSDDDRPVSIGNPFDLYRIKINGIERDMVVSTGENATEKAKRLVDSEAFDLEHIV